MVRRLAVPSRSARGVVWLLFVLLAAGLTSRVQAYQQYSVQTVNSIIPLKWNRLPVQYYIENVGAPGVTPSQLQAAVDAAFTTWHNVQTASVSAQFVGLTSARPFDDDGRVVIGFLDEPEKEGVLGATQYLIDDRTGEIVESDIFFNSSYPWSVSESGEARKFDLESIALHEIGHLWGLGHSALGETQQQSGGRSVTASGAVMFPIAFSPANTKLRVLQPDDIAGISDLYPAAGFTTETGTVSGTVTKSGKPVFGAHVVAFSPTSGTMIGNFTDENGNFSIAGVTPGFALVRVEPVDDADLDSFFDDPSQVDLNFRITYYRLLAVVPAGGSSVRLQIQVTPK